MTVSVTMPRLGESVSEGTVTRWLKQEGDQVEADEPLLEVSTDKVDTEIPSPAAGVLKSIKVGEDETVEVGSELAVIDDGAGGGSAQGADEQAEEPAEDDEPAAQEDTAPAKDEQPEEPAESEESAEPEQDEEPERQPEDEGEDTGESAASAQ